jgi:hypothetical protein
MNGTTAHIDIRKLTQKYWWMRFTEVLLLGMAVGITSFALLRFIQVPFVWLWSLSVSGALLTGSMRYIRAGLNKFNEHTIIRFLNENFPSLEDSADLLTHSPAALTLLEQLQQQKVSNEFGKLYPDIRIPQNIGQAGFILACSLIVAFALTSFHLHQTESASFQQIVSLKKDSVVADLPAEIKSMTITVTPPAYTQLQPYTTSDPQLRIPEGSHVAWRISFSGNVTTPQLMFSKGDSLLLKPSSTDDVAEATFSLADFYQVRWKTGEESKSSDYYKIEIITDRNPEVEIVNLNQFNELTIHDQLVLSINAMLRDDYGLSDAYITATVSKGSGESVKFREEKLNFTAPAVIQGKTLKASRTLDLLKLGLEPGDELYFYAVVFDNKKPNANHARTETYFISLRDTASETMSVEGGLGVDLMPDYFRSQRQIIIDTEKLIKQKKSISQRQFKSTSNELGYDQKVLRLKYGEFLGEEFESGIGIGVNEPHDDHDEEKEKDVTKLYGHVHDTENEHNLVQEKKAEEHHHAREENHNENPVAAFTHTHDDPEEATFFNMSVRAKLKAALSIMWDAELQLRLFEPEKSLPYQYRALKLLKEISNDSRIYVHKTGFDPPPLKEEKRLSGDLAELKNTSGEQDAFARASYAAIRKGLITTERLLRSSAATLHTDDKQVLHEAGQTLSALALQQPGKYLETLSIIKRITEDEIETAEIPSALSQIRKSFWEALPRETVHASQSTRSAQALDQQFIRHLNALKND